jgi:formamidopyrimidine-DNA glycosylase
MLGVAYVPFASLNACGSSSATPLNPAALTTVKSVNTKGKFMWWAFQRDRHDAYWLMNTFGMSGQWGAKVGKHPCFKFGFSDDTAIYFNDPRHFGTLKFVNDFQIVQDKLDSLGWDPFQIDVAMGINMVKDVLAATDKPIAQVLMDQGVFAGVGNYIKCECLYACAISPWKPCNALSNKEVQKLCYAIKEVMDTSYQHQGATILTYETPYGEEGRYSSVFKVYGKKTDPQGRKIIRETTPDKRTTHWCPDIQK